MEPQPSEKKFVSVEKKKSRINSTKQQKLHALLKQKKKDASNEKRSKEEDKIIRNEYLKRNESSLSATKKKRKRKNASSKEILSNYTGVNDIESSLTLDQIPNKDILGEFFADIPNSDEDEGADETSSTASETSTASNVSIPPIVIEEVGQKPKKEPKKPKIPKFKTIKSMKKTSTAKLKNFYTALVWDRSPMHPSLFRKNFEHYNEINQIDFGTDIVYEHKLRPGQDESVDILGEALNKITFSGKHQSVYISCIKCSKKIENQLAILVHDGLFVHKNCFPE
jgi:hypothetical protein